MKKLTALDISSSIANLLWFLLYLYAVYSMTASFCSLVWVGDASEMRCRTIDKEATCLVKYQALLHSSQREAKDIQQIRVDTKISSSDNGDITEYVTILQSRSGDYPLKTYSDSTDPELQELNYRYQEFVQHPKEGLKMSFHYNFWGQLIYSLVLFPFVFLTFLFFGTLLFCFISACLTYIFTELL